MTRNWKQQRRMKLASRAQQQASAAAGAGDKVVGRMTQEPCKVSSSSRMMQLGLRQALKQAAAAHLYLLTS